MRLEYGYVRNIIGKDIEVEMIKSICESLEMKISGETDEWIDIEVHALAVSPTVRSCRFSSAPPRFLSSVVFFSIS